MGCEGQESKGVKCLGSSLIHTHGFIFQLGPGMALRADRSLMPSRLRFLTYKMEIPAVLLSGSGEDEMRQCR